MYRQISEGLAKVYVPSEEKVSKELPVFYNPIMKMNRDFSMLVLKQSGLKDVQAGLPLCGTGVRGIRMLLELKNIKHVFFNDNNSEAVKIVRKNVLSNKLSKKKTTVTKLDANIFFQKSFGFDYIDIDPFGSPVRFLEPAISHLSREGILAVTATDTGALAGTFPSACRRKYWAQPLHFFGMHELGLRILIRRVQLSAMTFDRALVPILSYAKEHYMRVFFRARKGKEKTEEISMQHTFFLYCPVCLHQETSSWNNKSCCGKTMQHAGPLWTGKLCDDALLDKIGEDKGAKKNEELFSFLSVLKDEAQVPVVGFCDLHELASRNTFSPPKRDDLILRLRKHGFLAARTHTIPHGIKTNADSKTIVALLK